MTATARYPALDRVPALLSRRISTGELRSRLHFGGVAITDDLDVAALRPYGGAEGLALRAAAAGNDLLLYAQSAPRGARAAAALARGADPTAQRTAVRRVLALRRSLR